MIYILLSSSLALLQTPILVLSSSNSCIMTHSRNYAKATGNVPLSHVVTTRPSAPKGLPVPDIAKASTTNVRNRSQKPNQRNFEATDRNRPPKANKKSKTKEEQPKPTPNENPKKRKHDTTSAPAEIDDSNNKHHLSKKQKNEPLETLLEKRNKKTFATVPDWVKIVFPADVLDLVPASPSFFLDRLQPYVIYKKKQIFSGKTKVRLPVKRPHDYLDSKVRRICYLSRLDSQQVSNNRAKTLQSTIIEERKSILTSHGTPSLQGLPGPIQRSYLRGSR